MFVYAEQRNEYADSEAVQNAGGLYNEGFAFFHRALRFCQSQVSGLGDFP